MRNIYTISSDDQTTSIWNDVVSGTTAGLVSGLMVALMLWTINHFRRPKFEYFDVGNGLGHFHYNRLRPIIIGGTLLMHHGSTMVEQNPRAGDGGFYMSPMSDQVFATSHDRNFPLETGEEFLISYRLAPWKMRFCSKARVHAHDLRMDPLSVLNSKCSEDQPSDELKQLRKETRGWKTRHIPFLPSSTR